MFDEPVMRQFVHQLVVVVQGSIQTYNAVTGRLSEEEKRTAWRDYNQSFEERVMAGILEVLEKNQCNITEVCHAALKLLDAGARIMEAAGQMCPQQQPVSATVVPLDTAKRPKKRGVRGRKVSGKCIC